jgi:hypothetical protein
MGTHSCSPIINSQAGVSAGPDVVWRVYAVTSMSTKTVVHERVRQTTERTTLERPISSLFGRTVVSSDTPLHQLLGRRPNLNSTARLTCRTTSRPIEQRRVFAADGETLVGYLTIASNQSHGGSEPQPSRSQLRAQLVIRYQDLGRRGACVVHAPNGSAAWALEGSTSRGRRATRETELARADDEPVDDLGLRLLRRYPSIQQRQNGCPAGSA